MSKETTRNYRIEGMHCTSCAMTIDWEIEDVSGVVEANTSYAKAVTEVRFDPALTSEAEILAAIERAGFQSKPAS